MKKMMIIAVLISGMLMPAQIFAKNDRREVKKENRVSVDYNRVNKGGNVAKNHKPEPKKPAKADDDDDFDDLLGMFNKKK